MPFELDPVDYYKRVTAARNKTASEEDLNNDVSAFIPKFESGMARGYGQKFDQAGGLSSIMDQMDSGMNDSGGTAAVMGGLVADQQMEMGLGQAALGAMADMEIAEMQADIAEENRRSAAKQADKNRSAGTKNAVIGAVGGIGAAAIGAAI